MITTGQRDFFQSVFVGAKKKKSLGLLMSCLDSGKHKSDLISENDFLGGCKKNNKVLCLL